MLDTGLVSAVLTDRPPPIIRQGPSNQTLGVDSVALLKCQASGDPIPSISWLKDGLSLLGKDPRMSLQELGSLQIRNVKVRGRFLTPPQITAHSDIHFLFLLSASIGHSIRQSKFGFR